MTRLWRERVLPALLAQLKQGASPDGLALSAAVGLAISCFPLLGATTALSVAAGMALKLNQPALLLANYVGTPAQLALLLPFWKAGSVLIGARAPLHPEEMLALWRADWLGAARTYGAVVAGGALVWLAAAPLLAAGAYLALRPLMRRLGARP